MLENYLSQLENTALNAEKIKAIRLPVDELHTYIYFDYKKQLHLIIKSELLITESRKGIKIRNTELNLIDFGKHPFIDIICLHQDFKKEFIQIAEQIFEHYKNHKDLVKAIKITVNKWYFFFEKDSNDNLTVSEVKGLIGELIFMKNFSNKIPLRSILNAWKGPESGLRDYNFERFDVEVKTSSKEVGHVHSINGQFQLKSDNIPLFIYSVCLKKSDSANSITLKKLTDAICILLGDDPFSLNLFFKKLESINVFLNKIEYYDKFSYELKNILTIKIDKSNLNQFLIQNDNSRISNVKYDFDFNGIENCKIYES